MKAHHIAFFFFLILLTIGIIFPSVFETILAVFFFKLDNSKELKKKKQSGQAKPNGKEQYKIKWQPQNRHEYTWQNSKEEG